MIFIPRVNVVYHGEYHRSEIPFEIDETDADELKLYGEVIKPEQKAEDGTQVETQVETEDEPKPTAKPKPKKK